MIKVGIISFSDGRIRVHHSQEEYIKNCENKIKNTLFQTGEVETVVADEMIYNSELAKTQSQAIAAKNVDAIIFNVPVFAFPNFSLIAAKMQNVPILMQHLQCK